MLFKLLFEMVTSRADVKTSGTPVNLSYQIIHADELNKQ